MTGLPKPRPAHLSRIATLARSRPPASIDQLQAPPSQARPPPDAAALKARANTSDQARDQGGTRTGSCPRPAWQCRRRALLVSRETSQDARRRADQDQRTRAGLSFGLAYDHPAFPAFPLSRRDCDRGSSPSQAPTAAFHVKHAHRATQSPPARSRRSTPWKSSRPNPCPTLNRSTPTKLFESKARRLPRSRRQGDGGRAAGARKAVGLRRGLGRGSKSRGRSRRSRPGYWYFVSQPPPCSARVELECAPEPTNGRAECWAGFA
ncbi:hypothetical protein EV648_106215 [Kribbella sp. VKM Ac-2568]|nr:hypothetical protein EV648_106215 [Kribbella sp. VKM Ac-2568]